MLNLMAIATAAQLAVARLLYGMGAAGIAFVFRGNLRQDASARNNVLFVGVFILNRSADFAGGVRHSTGYDWEEIREFGALIAFMG